MALNPSIILAGQQPDMVNVLDRSNQAAYRANEMQRQNQLNQLYQRHGAGAVSGDQAAINALAAADPKLAMDFQQTHRANQVQDRQLDQNDRLFQMKIAEYRRSLSDAQAAKEAEEIKRGVFAASAAQTPEEWDAVVRQLGQENLVGQFGQKDVLLRQYMTAAQILEANKPQERQVIKGADGYSYYQDNGERVLPNVEKEQKPADEYERYVREEQAAGRDPMSRIEYKRAGQKTQRIDVAPDGSVSLVEDFGGSGGGKPPSERQSTLRLFGGLMDETMPKINAMEDDPNFDPTSARTTAAGGGVVGNFVTTPEARQYEALKRQWAEGVLRIQTGAAATEPEIRRVLDTYFPRFGDDEATIMQKRQQRDAFARSLVTASGDTMDAPGGADTRGGIGEPDPAPQQDETGFSDFQVDGQTYRVKRVD